MKKITLIFLFLMGLGILFNSCKKDTKDPVLNISKSAPALITGPEEGSAFVLTNEDSANMINYTWNAATYSVSDGAQLPLPSYSLQIDIADSNFAHAKELQSSNETSFGIIVYDMNTKLLQLGVEPDSTANIAIRVVSGISGAEYTNDTSKIVIASFTTYAKATPPPPAETPRLWIPGDYQGWNPGGAPNAWSVDNDGVYTGFVYFPEGGTYEFKFTSAPDWNHTNFGAGSSLGLLDTDPGAANLSVPDFGFYKLICDTLNLSWEYEAQNWGVIGSGILNGDWSEDVNLEWDAVNAVLSVTIDVTESQDGGDLRFKFRANDGWDINLGLMNPEDGKKLSYSGPDIPMPDGAGNYTFILDMSQEVPTYDLIKN
jgi:hypothetical protein